MGKAQSKRSIDITTDPKKVGEGDEVAGKVEKIEDVDQKVGDGAAAAAPPLNGDAATPKEGAGEAASTEKKDTEDHSENDKDLTTEKSASDAKGGSGEVGASGDGAAETSKDESAVATGSPKDTAGAEEISPLADESIKSKSKKDKVKKKWSFRSISFGKKDKQKPAKTEEPVSPTAAAAASPEASPAAAAEESAAVPPEPTTNGESAAPEQPKEEVAAVEPATTKDEVKPVENGSATAQEQQAANGGGDEKRPLTPPTTVEEPAIKPEETTATTTETTAETATKEAPTTATEVVTNGHGTATTEEVLTNGDKNGLASDESPVADSANIPSKVDDVEEPHQNGTNGSATPPPTPVAVAAPAAESEAEQIKNKSQIEVNQIDITPSNNNAHNNNYTVNTSTKTLTTTETETTETTITTATETETTIAAADLVQTQTNTTTSTNTVPTIPTPPPSNTTDTTTSTTTDNTNNTNITVTLPSVEEPSEEVKATPGEEEEQVVQAIIAAVSSEADAEGFVVVSAAADPVVDQENYSNDVSPKPELSIEPVAESVILTETSNPPPLPKSPPPSRVSAFVLAEEDDDDDATAAAPAAPETIDNEKLPVEVEDDKANNTEIEKIESEAEDLSIEIEHQAQIIVDEITEQAAEIVKCEQNNKEEPQIKEETKQVINVDLISNEIRQDQPEAAPIVAVEEDAEKTTPADDDADEDKSRLPENEVEQHVPEEVTDTQIEHDKLEISIDHLTEKLEALPRLNGDHDDDDAKANVEADLNELDRNNKDITKDLKEKNAAAAEVTTQELPVTCE